MTAEDFVIAHHPGADYKFQRIAGITEYAIFRPQGRMLGRGWTRSAAWTDAKRHILAGTLPEENPRYKGPKV
jgi:hypothetical protein